MSSHVIAVLDRFHPRIIEAIERALPTGWCARFTEENTVAARARVLQDADLAFVMAAPVPKELIDQALRLRFIQKLGAGMDRFDLEACRANGITVTRLQAGNNIPVAEHTVLLMLACYRQLPQIDKRTRAGQWSKEDARGTHKQLHGKTVGIVGFGAIGSMVAKMLQGFDVRIVYHDPIRPTPDVERAANVEYVDLDALLRVSDIVSLHLPLLPETRHLINEARIRAMKPGAVLINAARGGLVDEAALAGALRDGHLFAAGLDAFSAEPPVGSPLLEIENTVVTSHLAGATIDNFAGVIGRAVANAETFLRSEPLPVADIVVPPPQRNDPRREAAGASASTH
jgi:phosphoglycerate dehydrogenase-like enzyme